MRERRAKRRKGDFSGYVTGSVFYKRISRAQEGPRRRHNGGRECAAHYWIMGYFDPPRITESTMRDSGPERVRERGGPLKIARAQVGREEKSERAGRKRGDCVQCVREDKERARERAREIKGDTWKEMKEARGGCARREGDK